MIMKHLIKLLYQLCSRDSLANESKRTALAADDIPGDIIGMAHSILILCILHRIWAIRLFVAKTLPGNY